MRVHITPVDWATHKSALQRIREIVFVDEQQVPRELEWDGEDDVCAHFLALTEAGQPVGCARLMPSGQIGRMAVLPDHRGTGLGRRLLDEAIEEAMRRGFQRVHLHAQSHAAEFYRKAGFLPEGPEFMEAGIPHQAMTLELPIPFEAPQSVPRAAVPELANERDNAPDARPRSHRGEADCRTALLSLLDLPRRYLAIKSPLLDHALFDAEALTESISRFARSSPGAEVRILLEDSSLVVSRGHRLVELTRRLESHITIRRVNDGIPAGEDSFVIWDGVGLFLLPDFRTYEAISDPYDPVHAKRLLEAFDYLWARSAPDPELRTLSL